jgi:hypothetical protein
VLAGLVIGWLVYKQKWPLSLFFAIVISPFFVFSALFSNIDVLVTVLPILLWHMAEETENRYQRWFYQTAAFALLLLKPQAGVLVIGYWLFTQRYEWRSLVVPLLMIGIIVIPISMIGSPPLAMQWLDNIQNPSENNIQRWEANNVSLTNNANIIVALPVIMIAFGGLYFLMQQRGRQWSRNHTYSALLMISILLSPYASNQSVIGALAMVPSWSAVGIQYLFTALGAISGIYGSVVGWITLIYGISALWLYQPDVAEKSTETEEKEILPASPPLTP